MKKSNLRPSAFMSYVRSVDKHDNGSLTRFCQLLSEEVRAQTGEEFPIFQDTKDIKWGEQGQKAIKGSLDEIMFLFPSSPPASSKERLAGRSSKYS